MTAPTILVVLAAPTSAAACLRAATDAARALAAPRIEVLHVRMDPASAPGLPDVVTGRYEQAIEGRSAAEGALLRAAFDAWKASNRPADARWVEVEAIPSAAIRDRGKAAALLVVARPPDGARPADAAGFDAALFETGRPALVVGPGEGAAFGRHLAVGWRDAPATRRSLETLRPWLMAAEAVSVIAVDDEGAGIPDDWGAANLPSMATYHQVRAAGRSDGEALLAEAASLGADGLAIGAYLHGRLVERLFGGVTAETLRLAKIPVLMRA